jgi:hypothetical protein
MACPTAILNLNRSYNYTDNVYDYYSTISLQIDSGSSTAPIQGSMVATDFNGVKTTYFVQNANNSFTSCGFNVDKDFLYNVSNIVFTFILNNGDCNAVKEWSLYDDGFECESFGSQIIFQENCIREIPLSFGEISGCTNPLTINYNPAATIDDGSCDCSCPEIKITVLKSFDTLGQNTMHPTNSEAIVEVISGSTNTPISGWMELTDLDGDITKYFVNNFNNSKTYATFNVNSNTFFNKSKVEFTIFLNGMVCVFNKTVNFSNLDCVRTYDDDGITVLTEDCSSEYTLGGDIYGCTDPTSLTYNSCATIDDDSCEYSLSGCTNPLSSNYNPYATFDDGTCILPVFGCTDPTSLTYNPNATVDNGSCFYPSTLGCTNPLASNYNPSADFNDGTCIFASGCTSSGATNYNPSAVIDDGSCECAELELIFNLNGINTFYFVNTGDTACDYYLEFDYRLILNCSEIINYFQNKSDLTILQILDRLKLYSEVKNNTSTYRQIELDINPTTDPIFYYELSGCTENYLGYSGCTAEYLALSGCPDEYLVLSSCTEDCFNLKALISAELGTTCPEDVDSLFNNSWRTAILKIPSTYLNGDAQLGVFLEGFAFGGTNVLFDNIKLYSICSTSVEDCIIIPYNFGFDILTVEDNIKSNYDVDTNKDVLNTKEITLKVDVPNYVKIDVVSFLNTYEHLYHRIFKGITIEKIEQEFLPVRSLLTNDVYYYYQHLYESYLNSFEYCSAKSKALDYDFMFKVFSKINLDWLDLVKQVLPETAIWNEHNQYISNFLFHQQKFAYRKYLIVQGTNINNVVSTCILKSIDQCGQTPSFEYQMDHLLQVNVNECLVDTYATPINLTESTLGGGRLLQYNKTTNEHILRYNYPDQNFEPCV